jgi:hypothetical protein
LLIVAKVSRECLVIIWLVTDAFILLTVHYIVGNTPQACARLRAGPRPSYYIDDHG